MFRTLIAGLAVVSSANGALAQSFLLDPDVRRSLLYRQIGDSPRMICIDLQSADGMASPVLVSQVSHTRDGKTGTVDSKLLDTRIRSGTTCLQVPDGVVRYEIFGTALEEPVVVRVGRSRCALRDPGARRPFDSCRMAEPGAMERLPVGQ